MFGHGTFRPMMGELKLAQGYGPMPGAGPATAAPDASAPAPAPAPAPTPVVVPTPVVADKGPSTSTLVLAGLAGFVILGSIFFTD